MASFANYLSILGTNTRIPKVKVELLRDEDESVYQEITSLLTNSGGSISVQRQNGIRRTASITLYNIDNTTLPNYNNGIWWRKKFQISIGYEEADGSTYWHPQGVFCMEDIDVESNYSSKSVTIRGIDKFSVIDGTLGGETDSTYIVPVGTSIFSAIQSVLTLVGDVKQPILHSSFYGEVTPYTIELETGDPLSSILEQLAEMVSAFVYYDTTGHLVFEPDVDDSEKASLYNFSTETIDYNYMGASRTYKFSELYNSVLVIGDNINGEIFDYKTQNNNLSSDVSIPNVGFERVYVVKDENISTTALAQRRSVYELKIITALQSEVSITSVPIYHLDVESVVTISDPALGLSENRFLINGLEIPLNTSGDMQIDLVNVKEFEFDY